MSAGARLAASADPVGASSSSPSVSTTMLIQKPTKLWPSATLPAPAA